MMVGAAYGAGFGALLTLVPAISSSMRIVAGVVFGALVFALSSFVFLPLMSNIAQDPAAIRNMARIVGYPTFLVEHLLFGLVLGALSRATTVEAAPRSDRPPSRSEHCVW